MDKEREQRIALLKVLGVVGLSLGAALLAIQLRFMRCARCLKKQIETGWQHNPDIRQLQVQVEHSLISSGNKKTQFNVKVLSTSSSTVKDNLKQQKNPFVRENSGKLWISSLSDTHVLLYNKYPIIAHHVLLVTKQFVPQNSILTEADFATSLLVMRALNGLVFFNSGPEAGASQSHKHIQAIPYTRLPIEPLLEPELAKRDLSHGRAFFKLPEFQFEHVYCRYPPAIIPWMTQQQVNIKAKELTQNYEECLRIIRNDSLCLPYNLVLTKQWMLVVPRKCEVAMNVLKINALGFTGSFAVRSEADYKVILTCYLAIARNHVASWCY